MYEMREIDEGISNFASETARWESESVARPIRFVRGWRWGARMREGEGTTRDGRLERGLVVERRAQLE